MDKLKLVQDISKYSGVSSNSRTVAENNIFFAINGFKESGEYYVREAIKNGATSIVSESEIPNLPVSNYIVSNIRKVLAEVASLFYHKMPETIVGVTGTNGKTSVAEFARQIAESFGKNAASIGTLGVCYKNLEQDGIFEYSPLTASDPVILHKNLEILSKMECNFVSMEISSHGLSQYRSDYVSLKAAAFTNLSQDHLDYHKTMDEYFLAKLRLFQELLLKDKTAVINKDSNYYEKIHQICIERGIKVISFGENADISISKVKDNNITLNAFGTEYTSKFNLMGEFQIYNLMCAMGLLIGSGFSVSEIIKHIPNIKPIKGRFEHVARHNSADVFVDFAHTPDSLLVVLKNLRSLYDGKIILVFGCGGERDSDKRYKMGEIADKMADIIIVTDDNPRKEPPEKIRKMILEKCNKAIEIASREEAIIYAMDMAKKGDVVLIAGKGHENYQIYGEQKFYFSDQEIAREYSHIS